jgi:DNA-binding IclR family transcriptional regulator
MSTRWGKVHGAPIGAISVAAPSSRLGDEKIKQTAPLLISTANKISSLLGQNSHLINSNIQKR